MRIRRSVELLRGAVFADISATAVSERGRLFLAMDNPPVSPGAWFDDGAPRGRQRSTVTLVGSVRQSRKCHGITAGVDAHSPPRTSMLRVPLTRLKHGRAGLIRTWSQRLWARRGL